MNSVNSEMEDYTAAPIAKDEIEELSYDGECLHTFDFSC